MSAESLLRVRLQSDDDIVDLENCEATMGSSYSGSLTEAAVETGFRDRKNRTE